MAGKPKKARSEVVAADGDAAELASKQYGLITRGQAVGLGFHPNAIRVRLKSRRWSKVHPGVYAFAGVPSSRRRDLMAAILAVGDDAVATSYSAAEVWGLPNIFLARLPMVATGKDKESEAAGVTVASHAVRRSLLVPDDLRRAVDAAGNLRGLGKLRTILASGALERAFRSAAEFSVSQLLEDAGFKDLVINEVLQVGEVRVGEPDLRREGFMLLVEVDGPGHDAEPQKTIDRIRTAAYRALGYAVVRGSPTELNSKQTLIGRVSRELRKRTPPVTHQQFLILWKQLNDAVPPSHRPPQGEFPSAYALLI